MMRSKINHIGLISHILVNLRYQIDETDAGWIDHQINIGNGAVFHLLIHQVEAIRMFYA